MSREIPPNKISLPDRLQPNSAHAFSPHEEGHSSASDTEYQHALEVIFDAQNAHRRRSSLVGDEPLGITSQRRKNSECYVHALLESQRKTGKAGSGGLDDIAETLSQSRIDSGEDHATAVDPKGNSSGSGDHDVNDNHAREGGPGPGQEDQSSWKRGREMRDTPGGGEATGDESTRDQEKLEIETPNAVHSRLLTKKQLSDMAWGVRELSKRLGSIRLKLKVKTVFLLTKAHDESLIENSREVARWLLSPERQVRYTVWVEDKLKNQRKFNVKGLLEELHAEYQAKGGEAGNLDRRLRYWNNDMCRTRPHSFDFVVTLGGDGTVLYASWLFQRIVPPVLSFALGSLGFLTKFDYEDFEGTLTTAFRDGVTISLRLRFEGTVMRSQRRKRRVGSVTNGDADAKKEVGDQENGEGGNQDEGDEDAEEDRDRDLVEELVGEEKEDERTHRPDGTYEILNDIVVDRGPNPTMSSIEIFGDDTHFTTVQADGICVSTPTGSTAYNLAAGGSLCHPDNPVILVTAICAHTLSFRPIILPDTMVLRLGVPYDARTSCWASFDGRERVELGRGDYVTVSASRFPFAGVLRRSVKEKGRGDRGLGLQGEGSGSGSGSGNGGENASGSEDWVESISGKLGWNTRQRQKSYKEWTS